MSRPLGRVARLREIENLLFRNTQGLPAAEIARACGVNRRTIYRDIDLLSEAGVPIWQNDGRYGIIRDQYLATVRLSMHEAAALYIATRLLARHADEQNPYTTSALNKLATAFPDPLSKHINRTAETITTRPVDPAYVAVLETIIEGWVSNHKLRVWYRSPRSGTLRERTLSPYLLEPTISGGLYVIGYDDWAEDLRTFKLERLERAELLDETYTIPDSFDPTEHLADAWGIMSGAETQTVTLRFRPAVGPLVAERIWHSSQTLTTEADGHVTLTVKVADPREMRPWIRSWGSDVEVLEPPFLRQDLIQEAQLLTTVYLPDQTD